MNCIYCQSPLTKMAKYYRNTCSCAYQKVQQAFYNEAICSMHCDIDVIINNITYQIIFNTKGSTLIFPEVSSQNKEIVSQIIPKEISLPALQSTILRILKLNNFK